MTYSYSVPVDPFDEHWDAIGAAIDALPPGRGQNEARAHRAAVGVAVIELAQLVPPDDKGARPRQVSVTGYGDENTASVNVSVFRPAVATTQG